MISSLVDAGRIGKHCAVDSELDLERIETSREGDGGILGRRYSMSRIVEVEE